jgi:hypothetical protein
MYSEIFEKIRVILKASLEAALLPANIPLNLSQSMSTNVFRIELNITVQKKKKKINYSSQ